MLHFSDNTSADSLNRLKFNSKLDIIIDNIITNSNCCLQPNENICIDESLVKFMKILAFNQYIKNKKRQIWHQRILIMYFSLLYYNYQSILWNRN